MEHNISVVGLAGADAELAFKVNNPNSTSVSIGNPPNSRTFPPTTSFRNVGKFPCKIRLKFTFRMHPWTLEVSFPEGSPLHVEGGQNSPKEVVVFIDFTTDSNTDPT